MPSLNFKHINANEQIFDGSIGTSLLADGSVTSTKLAIGAITSSSLLINSPVNFNNFPVEDFRIENVTVLPLPGNAGRLVWDTVDNELFIDSEIAVTITSASNAVFNIVSVVDSTNLVVSSTTGITAGDTINQGVNSTLVAAVPDATHLVVNSTVGFVGQGVASVSFGIVVVTDATNLQVDNTIGMVAGYTITQGLNSTIITAVIDATHITVADTTGFISGLATVLIPFNVTTVTDGTHLVVSNTLGMGPADVITQNGTNTTIVTVTDSTHLVVVSTASWAPNAAGDNSLSLSSTAGVVAGMYLTQGAFTSEILVVLDATHVILANSAGFIVGPASVGTFLPILEGAAVTSISGTADEVLVNGTFGVPTTGPVTLTTPQPIGLTSSPTFGGLTLTGDLLIGSDATITASDGSVSFDSGAITSDGSGNLTVNGGIISNSTTTGFLLPRMTTAQRDAIVSPATGLEIYNTDTNSFNFYTGIAWLPVGSPVGAVGDVQFNAGGGLFGSNANFFWNNTTHRLGIGNAAPTTTLDVTGTGHFSGNLAVANLYASNGSVTAPSISFTSDTGTGIYYQVVGGNPEALQFTIAGGAYTGGIPALSINGNNGIECNLGLDARAGISVPGGNIVIETVGAGNGIIFTDAGGGNQILLTYPSGGATAYTLILPVAQATVTGQTLINDGSGNLSWANFNTGALSLDSGAITTDGSGNLYVGGSIAINSTHAVADPSAALDIVSTTRGFLPPRMTSVQRNAIVSPATGLEIYNTDTNTLQDYNGTAWSNVAPQFQQDLFHPAAAQNVFVLSHIPVTNSQIVFFNGLALALGAGEDYTLSGNTVTLNALYNVTVNDKVLVTYSY